RPIHDEGFRLSQRMYTGLGNNRYAAVSITRFSIAAFLSAPLASSGGIPRLNRFWIAGVGIVAPPPAVGPPRQAPLDDAIEALHRASPVVMREHTFPACPREPGALAAIS